MKLSVRDVFAWQEKRWRLLHTDKPNLKAVVIDLGDANAWPMKVDYSDIAQCEREPGGSVGIPLSFSSARTMKVEADYARLQQVLSAKDALFEGEPRRRWLVKVSERTERCVKTLENLLRRYWQRGMTKSALLPDYDNCGRHSHGATAGRGRTPMKHTGGIYQVTEDDTPKLKAGCEHYLAEKRKSVEKAYQWLVENYYLRSDANGKRWVLGNGERPTLRQFAYFMKKNYSLELRLRKRHGDKQYIKDHKPTLSDTIADCIGVADVYEIDASIADVPIVSEIDFKTIINKATIYLIVDRKSRLITGFYLGLEYACWETAVEAILSLVESKRALCERYGITYDARDWPADGLLPSKILGDHAEMISKHSNSLPNELGVDCSNPPSLLPNWKPNVETRFKLITVHLRNIAPGYDPPENFGKRRTEQYDKETCLTLHDLSALVIEAIIKHNRTPIKAYPRSTGEILREVEPSPLALWDDAVTQYGHMGKRFDEEAVRMALLPRDTAQITHDGLLFKNLYFSSDDPRLVRAFIQADKGRRPITVSYDRRSVDQIYIHMRDSPKQWVVAPLSPKNHGYAGLSFGEAHAVQKLAKNQAPGFDQTALQVAFESNEQSTDRIRAAEARRDDLGRLSVRSRKANTVPARMEQKRHERIDLANRIANRDEPASVTRTATVEPPKVDATPLQLAPSAAQLLRQKMSRV